jgi:hypothetical protein
MRGSVAALLLSCLLGSGSCGIRAAEAPPHRERPLTVDLPTPPRPSGSHSVPAAPPPSYGNRVVQRPLQPSAVPGDGAASSAWE